jgi:hypothetical protein
VSWWRRGRRDGDETGAGRHAGRPGTAPAGTGPHDAARDEAAPDHAAPDHAAPDHAAPAEAGPDDAGGRLSDRSAGPWDATDVEGSEGYVDLGGLWLRGRDGMELRLEIDEESGRVTAATVQLEGSAVQLQAFAAPRTEGIWDEIRAEIAAGVTRQGGTVDDVPGPFGRELLASIPVRTPDGGSAQTPARFAGIDGPRWFLRAVFHGAAAYEAGRAGTLESVVRDVVVVRGPDAMAPRELLPLRPPDEPAPEPLEQDEVAREPLEPFQRGPEITEVR